MQYNNRGYSNPASSGRAPAIRAGLSVQELKAMTAMRMAQTGTDPSTTTPVTQNISSSYQTATPQQLQAAGIQPVVINDSTARTPRMRSARPMNSGSNAPYNNFPAGGMNNPVNSEYGSFNNRSVPTTNNFSSGPENHFSSGRPSSNSNSSNPSSLSSYHQLLLPQRNGPSGSSHLQNEYNNGPGGVFPREGLSKNSSYLGDDHHASHHHSTHANNSMLPNLGPSSRGSSGGGSRGLTGHLPTDIHMSMHQQMHSNGSKPSSAASVSSWDSFGPHHDSDASISASLASQLSSNPASSLPLNHPHHHTNYNNPHTHNNHNPHTHNPHNHPHHSNSNSHAHSSSQAQTPRLSSLPFPAHSYDQHHPDSSLSSGRGNGNGNGYGSSSHSHSNLPTPIGTSRGVNGPEVRTPLPSAGSMGYSLDHYQQQQQQHHQQYPDEESEFYSYPNHNHGQGQGHGHHAGAIGSGSKMTSSNFNKVDALTHSMSQLSTNHQTMFDGLPTTGHLTNSTNPSTTSTPSPFKRPLLHKARSQPLIATEDCDRLQYDANEPSGLLSSLPVNRLPSLPLTNSPLEVNHNHGSGLLGSASHASILPTSSPGDLWPKSLPLPLPSLGESHHTLGSLTDPFSPNVGGGSSGGAHTPASTSSSLGPSPLPGKPFPFMKSKTAPRLNTLSPLTVDPNASPNPLLVGNLLPQQSSGSKPFLKKLFAPSSINGSHGAFSQTPGRERAGSQESMTNDELNDSSFCHAMIDSLLDNNTPVHANHKSYGGNSGNSGNVHMNNNHHISPTDSEKKQTRAFFPDCDDEDNFYSIDGEEEIGSGQGQPPNHHQQQAYSYDFEEEQGDSHDYYHQSSYHHQPQYQQQPPPQHSRHLLSSL